MIVRFALLALLLVAPSCIVVSDRAGVSVRAEQLDGFEVGRTSRAQVLQRLGPPTGLFRVDLLRSAVRLGDLLQAPTTPGRVDRDVLAWQEVRVSTQLIFFPVLFAWGNSSVTRATFVAWFDESGELVDMAFREDAP